MGDLLAENGMSVNRYEDASIQDLANVLSMGKGIVTAVDCEPLWGEPGGHALWVTGLEVNQDGIPESVVCNDSGRPDGQAIMYPYDNFMQAWGAYNHMMVATVKPILDIAI
jgi:hypothetical protein